MPDAPPSPRHTHLEIRDWSEHQHYHDRRPPWIKLHRSILTNARFLGLPEAAQAQLVKLWVLASQMGHPLPYNKKLLAGQIGTTGRFYLDTLIASGLLIPCYHDASAVLADSKQNARPLRTENRERVQKEKKPAPENPARGHPGWLVPICAVWERYKGKGSFKWGKAGKLLKPLHEAGHSGEKIAANLERYVPKAGEFVSLARFAETFADHDEIKLSGPAVVDGWMSPEVDRLTAPGRVA